MADINYAHFLSGYAQQMPELTDEDRIVIQKYRNTIRIPAVVISDINDHVSTVAARRCIRSIADTSSQVDPVILPASTPATVHQDITPLGFTWADWKWPKNPGETRIGPYGLVLTGYGAKNIQKVFSCSVSHMRAWAHCILSRRPLMILEHDAIFTRKWAYGYRTEKYLLSQNGPGAVAINSPVGATFNSKKYYNILQTQYVDARNNVAEGGLPFDDPQPHMAKYLNVPMVAGSEIPQGLPGNSAYIVTPKFCIELFKKTREVGIWPNDALMCQQLFPHQLKVLFPHATELQGVQSTTQG